MKRSILVGTIVLLAGSLVAAGADTKDEVKGAAKKLADKSNYSWTTIVKTPDGAGGGAGGRLRIGPTEGKTEKDGFTCLSMTRGDNTIEAVLKGTKGAIKMPDGWMSMSEAAEADQQNPARFIAVTLQSFKNPAAQAEDLVAKAKELKKTDDAYTGDLTEEGVKELLRFGRGGGNAPAPTNARGSVKFWMKDGMLTKYEFTVQGTISINGNDRNIDRTSTVEVKEVGSTKLDVPEAAKQKAS